MIRIGVHNAERVLFEDPLVWRSIPDLSNLRDQWAISKISPELKPTGRRAIINLLESATENHEKQLSVYFKQEVKIERIYANSVKNIELSINDQIDIDDADIYTGISSYREGDKIKLTLWR